MENLPASIVVLEACGGAHYWARELQRLGHQAMLIAPQYVKPFVTGQKNDAADAEAIVIAAQRPEMRFLEPKSNEPAGALTITLPAFMADSPYEHAIWDFASQHQAVAITMRYFDRNFDLVAEGIDLALRMGELPDSALRSRRLGSFGRKLVCAPSY